ncbi:MAG: ribbon-helix-helix domain-containing protein [Pseudomonadota bacterium]
MRKRSLTLKGHRTSVALEPEFWGALEALARTDGLSLGQLVSKIDAERMTQQPPRNLASALRVYALQGAATSVGSPPE